jgi:pyridoxine 5-phosphate synthase
MATKLSVNLNKVATLRNTRTIGVPSVTHFARVCLDAGAHGITIHPRPDERHIRPHDVDEVAGVVTAYPTAELNIEGNPFQGLVEHAQRVRPTQCTLVPDSVAQATSDHGWNLPEDAGALRPVVARLHALGCRVSLFLDAVPEAVRRAKDVGADRVELFTEPYAAAFGRGAHERVLSTFQDAALTAADAGLGVNAGHDLNLDNLGPFLAVVPGLLEVSIGHALVADALELGMAETVRRYLAVVTSGLSLASAPPGTPRAS